MPTIRKLFTISEVKAILAEHEGVSPPNIVNYKNCQLLFNDYGPSGAKPMAGNSFIFEYDKVSEL